MPRHYARSGKTLILAEFADFWYTLAAITLVALIAFLLLFREETHSQGTTD